MIRASLATLTAMLATNPAFALQAADQYIGKPDCLVYNPRPVADEAVQWSGPCKDGYADGNGILIWTVKGEQSSRYEGGMKRGRKHGPSAQQDADGTIAWGDFFEGKRQGKTQIEHENRYTLFGVFEAGKLKGPVTVKYISGNQYTGGWGAHGPEGRGTMEYATGGSFSGEWKDGHWYSNGMITYPNGIRREPAAAVPVTPDPAAAPEQKRDFKLARDMNSLYRMEPLVKGASVPFNKAYANLSPSEQREVRSWFPVLQDDDIPPYPVKGSTEIYKAISAAHNAYHDSGMLAMDVLIDEEGTPRDVVIRRSPGKEVSEFVAKVLLVSKFTPATCGGKPCAMRYPVRIDLRRF